MKFADIPTIISYKDLVNHKTNSLSPTDYLNIQVKSDLIQGVMNNPVQSFIDDRGFLSQILHWYSLASVNYLMHLKTITVFTFCITYI